MTNYDMMLQWYNEDSQEERGREGLYHEGVEYDSYTLDLLMNNKLIIDDGVPYIGIYYPNYYLRTFNPYDNRFVSYCEITKQGYTYLKKECVEVMTDEERAEYYQLEHWAIMKHNEAESALLVPEDEHLAVIDWNYDFLSMVMITISTLIINIGLYIISR